MKRFHYILSLTLSLLLALPSHAQQEQNPQRRTATMTRGERKTNKSKDPLSDLSVRAQELNQRLSQEVGNAPWMRVMYREVDLLKEQNGPLYYPVRPMNGMSNLFSRIFALMGENKLKTYEYLDGYEVFDEAHEIDFKELLDRFYILYEEVPGENRNDTLFVVNESDVPSEQVKAYYVKEAWYFDQNNSVFDVKTLAICPILTVDGDMGMTRMPMFWLPYENIRPYISSAYIMTSNTNNAMTFTMDDYFRRRMFDGEIVKTQNLLNRPLQAYCPTPDSLKREQARIEQQLVAFEDHLWTKPDTLAVEDSKSKKSKKEAVKEKKKEKKKEAKPLKEPKAAKAGTVKSVRRRR